MTKLSKRSSTLPQTFSNSELLAVLEFYRTETNHKRTVTREMIRNKFNYAKERAEVVFVAARWAYNLQEKERQQRNQRKQCQNLI